MLNSRQAVKLPNPFRFPSLDRKKKIGGRGRAALENNFKLVWLWSGAPVDPTKSLPEESGCYVIAEVWSVTQPKRHALEWLQKICSYHQGSFLAAPYPGDSNLLCCTGSFEPLRWTILCVWGISESVGPPSFSFRNPLTGPEKPTVFSPRDKKKS